MSYANRKLPIILGGYILILGHGFSRAPRWSSAYAFTELVQDMLALFGGYSK